MSDSKYNAFLNRFSPSGGTVLFVALLIFIVLIISGFYQGSDTQSEVAAWFEMPLSKADMGDMLIVLFLFAVCKRIILFPFALLVGRH